LAQEKENIKVYTVYKHTSPDGKIYIGITSQRPKQRWNCGNGYKNNLYFTRAINKYGWDNFIHEILYDKLSEKEAKEIEIDLIANYRSNERKYGYNISSGGESKKGTKISEWQKKKISEASKGKNVSKETRKKLSIATSKTWANPEYKEKMRAMNVGVNNPCYGKKLTDEEKKIRGAKGILQYSQDNIFINEYISLHEANKITNISRDSITKCCKGIYKQAGGFVWKYKA